MFVRIIKNCTVYNYSLRLAVHVLSHDAFELASIGQHGHSPSQPISIYSGSARVGRLTSCEPNTTADFAKSTVGMQ